MKNLLSYCLILVLGLILGGTQLAVGQSEIAREDFFGALRSGMAMNEKVFPRRSTKTTKTFSGKGVTEQNTEVSEYLSSDRMRRLTTSTYEREKSISEVIHANGKFYCRLDGGEWEVSSTYCAPLSFSELPDSTNVKYTALDTKVHGKPVRQFEQTLIYEVQDEDRPGIKTLWRLNDIFWIGEDGRLLKREMKYSKNDSKVVDNETLEIFDFAPNDIKIEAPIK